MIEKVALHNDFSDCKTTVQFQLQMQIQAMKAENEAFRALMAVIPQNIKDEVIKLYVQGTEAASDEAYFRRAQRATLDEKQYREAQNIAHEAWKKMMKVETK